MPSPSWGFRRGGSSSTLLTAASLEDRLGLSWINACEMSFLHARVLSSRFRVTNLFMNASSLHPSSDEGIWLEWPDWGTKEEAMNLSENHTNMYSHCRCLLLPCRASFRPRLHRQRQNYRNDGEQYEKWSGSRSSFSLSLSLFPFHLPTWLLVPITLVHFILSAVCLQLHEVSWLTIGCLGAGCRSCLSSM